MFPYSRKARIKSYSISWFQIPVFTVKPRAVSGISHVVFPIELQPSSQSNIYGDLPLCCLPSLMHLSSFPCYGPSLSYCSNFKLWPLLLQLPMISVQVSVSQSGNFHKIETWSDYGANLGIFSSVMCGLRSLDATVRGRYWNPEAEGSTARLWTIRELLIPGNINRWKITQKPPYIY